jgi:hypothetical protein
MDRGSCFAGVQRLWNWHSVGAILNVVMDQLFADKLPLPTPFLG